jgi:glucokinase
MVNGIGICAPGPLDPHTGILFRAANVPSWINYPLQQNVETAFRVPVVIGNDANMAAMGEWKYGAGRGHNDVLYLTISTGIGGGVITGGRMLVGVHGMATELGHVTVVPDGPVCGCGQRGHLEALAAGPAIALTARTKLKAGVKSTINETLNGDFDTVTARHIGEAAKGGDAFAISLLAEAGQHIGHALAGFVHFSNPSIIIIGGGVAINVGDLLLNPMRAAMLDRLMDEHYACDIVLAELGDDVGLLGTLALAMESFPTKE